ncbi:MULTISPECIES: hypothetical protein [unclassified Mycolicibacterium]|uniref:hypothetical protein n=1 Tax=unclassified Mycolicibacterium TaxID=2636767 RepID=UPI002EDAEFDE
MTDNAAPGIGWMSKPFDAARSCRYVVVACIAALAFGILLPTDPWAAVAWLVLIPLAFAAPVAALAVLVVVTVLVPWQMQDTLKVIGGTDQAGLLFVDVLLLLGLVRIGWLLIRRRLVFDLPIFLGAIVAAICAASLSWGLWRGADLSEAGHEWRHVTLGVGAFLLAWPLLAKRSARRKLSWVLLGLGFALGLWGIAQWVFSVDFTASGDVGVRGGLSSGQLQGGLYAYPVAVTMAWAALVTGPVRNVTVKALLAVILLLNTACLLLTLERSFMVATTVACMFVVVTSGGGARRGAVRWSGVIAALLTAGAAIAQAEAQTAFDRLTSVGRIGSDNSYTHRLAEAHVLNEAIAARPLTGSGFGATVTWGVRDTFDTSTTPFADMGYHWLAWKIGLPAAAAIVLLLARAVFRRMPGRDGAEWHALRTGSRASLLALMLIGITFGVFDALGVTAVMGLLVAICYSRADSLTEPRPHIHGSPAARAERGRTGMPPVSERCAGICDASCARGQPLALPKPGRTEWLT